MKRLETKLTLKKETIEELTDSQLKNVAGGGGTLIKTQCGYDSCVSGICPTGTGTCVTDGCCG